MGHLAKGDRVLGAVEAQGVGDGSRLAAQPPGVISEFVVIQVAEPFAQGVEGGQSFQADQGGLAAQELGVEPAVLAEGRVLPAPRHVAGIVVLAGDLPVARHGGPQAGQVDALRWPRRRRSRAR